MERKAIFAGSFNPFTIGHASIVERALKLFDRIIIVIGVNSKKQDHDIDERFRNISCLYKNEPRVEVLSWDGLMADLARREKVDFLIRGLRTNADFEYERNMADINRRLVGVETIFFPTLPDHTPISSSMVRELSMYNADVSWMLPQNKK